MFEFGTKIGVFLKIMNSLEFALVGIAVVTVFTKNKVVGELHV